MNLYALQTGFRDLLLKDGPPQGTPYDAGLRVYHYAYRMRLLTLLRSTFDKTWTWIGVEQFESAANQHIDGHSPRSWTLDDYGADFHQTLAALMPEEPEVAELAWLEWVMRSAFSGLDGPVFTAAEFAASADEEGACERLCFDCVGSLQARLIATNCAGVWHALVEKSEAPTALLLDQPALLYVWRKNLVSVFRVFKPEEQSVFAMIREGHDFGHICTVAAKRMTAHAAAETVGSMLASWIGEGMIGSVRAPVTA
jgi:hypothetical protein